MDRRSFVTQMSILGMGLPAISGTILDRTLAEEDANRTVKIAGLMSVALINDAFNLVFAIPDIDPVTRIALTQNLSLKLPGNRGWLANFLIAKNDELANLLEDFKSYKEDVKIQGKLSLLYGAAAYTSLYNAVGPIYQANTETLEELLMTHDGYFLQEMAGKAGERLPDQDEVERLLLALAPRSVERIHTLIPDLDDGEGWLHRMVAWRNDYRRRAKEYAKVISQPNQNHLKKYVIDPHLYDQNDEVIELAQKYSRAERVTGVEVVRLLERNAHPKSLYGQALLDGISDILAMDRYFSGRRATLDRFKP